MTLDLDLRDVVYSELRPSAAAIRAPESSDYTRNAPDPALIDFVVVKVLVPILTTMVGALFTRWLAKQSERDAKATTESEISELRRRVDRLAASTFMEPGLDEEVDSVILELLRLRSMDEPVDGPPMAVREEIISVLQAYHLPAPTARKQADAIIARIFLSK